MVTRISSTSFFSSSGFLFFFSFLPFAPLLFTLSPVVLFRSHPYEAARSIVGAGIVAHSFCPFILLLLRPFLSTRSLFPPSLSPVVFRPARSLVVPPSSLNSFRSFLVRSRLAVNLLSFISALDSHLHRLHSHLTPFPLVPALIISSGSSFNPRLVVLRSIAVRQVNWLPAVDVSIPTSLLCNCLNPIASSLDEPH